MKYLLLAAVVTLSLSACDLFSEKEVGQGKPGQYPPSLWDKRDRLAVVDNDWQRPEIGLLHISLLKHQKIC